MNNLQIFKNDELGQIRAIEKDGQPWFVAKDICECLGLGDTSKAMMRLDVDEKGTNSIPTLGGNQEMWCVNEYGLYNLILASRKPEAKKFKRWVTHEVLPSIRQHGGYITNQENLAPEQIVAQALIVANNIIQEKDRLLQEQKPKVLFADAVSTSHTSILVGELAKLINQNGIDIGQNRLFEWLRDNGFLIKRQGTDYNMPTQYSMDLGLFEIKERSIANPDGSVRITKTPKVTGKGQQYFINKFLS